MIRLEDRGHVAVVTLDRPERRNAVDRAALEELAGVVDGLGPDIRVLVLTGTGGHFCAGADLGDVEDGAFVATLGRVLEQLSDAPLVTMAAVEGAALGAGTQLAVACDLRIAAGAASFGIPAARLGLAVDGWTVERLTRLAGHGPARAMLLAAEVFSGERLHGMGVVQRLGNLDAALEWADAIAALAPLTIRAHKASLAALDDPAAGDRARTSRDRAWASQDFQEGLLAFRKGRRPHFSGR